MNSNPSGRAFCSAPEEGELLPLFGRLKASSAQTGGAFEVFDYEGPALPPPHVHHNHDECFCITAGRFTFILGTEEVEAQAGSVVVIPRGTRHAFRAGEGARALLFVIPAGLEGYFRELSEGLAAGRSPVELRTALAEKYDSEPVG